MIRWSPISSVFSMEPEGITRAWPIVPLISRKARMTQTHATISFPMRVLNENLRSVAERFLLALLVSAFTFHRHRFPRFRIFRDFQLHEVGGIDAGIATGTEISFRVAYRLAQSPERKIAQGIGTQEFADVFRGIGRGDQFFLGWRIDAVIAGRNCWRTTDPHVNFLGAGFTNHAHQFAAGRAAHDGIVHEHNTLSGDQTANRIQLQLHTEIANRLRWLDERTANVVIADESHAKWDFGFE